MLYFESNNLQNDFAARWNVSPVPSKVECINIKK